MDRWSFPLHVGRAAIDEDQVQDKLCFECHRRDSIAQRRRHRRVSTRAQGHRQRNARDVVHYRAVQVGEKKKVADEREKEEIHRKRE